MQQYLEAGKVVTTHGVRGEMKLELWCDGVDFLKKVGNEFFEDTIMQEFLNNDRGSAL